MTNYLSEKIKVFSLFAIILVLYIHSGFHPDEILGMEINIQVQDFISRMLGRCAVPLFYAISGYLFFYSAKNMSSVFDKMKKRVNTLLIPYIIASVFFLSFYLFIDAVPALERFINAKFLDKLLNNTWYVIFYKVFFKADSGFPVAFHLWFLRDLILVVLFAPVWYYLYKYLKWFWLIPVIALNIVYGSSFFICALFWFGLGGAISKHMVFFRGLKISRVFTFTLLAIYLLLSILQMVSAHLVIWEYALVPITMLGVASLWLLYDIIVPDNFEINNHPWMANAASFSFFIYLFHEPTINIIRKLIALVLGKGSFGFLISYLVSPWIFVIIAVLVGILLKRMIPKVYNVLVGGR